MHSVRRVASSRAIELVGGGGTDMAQGIVTALRLRPRPSLVVVLTDGETPWPASPPRGTHVVAGLLGPFPADPPAWVRRVRIPDAAGAEL